MDGDAAVEEHRVVQDAQLARVLARGRIVATGGPELAEELERTGYAAYGEQEQEAVSPGPDEDPFADPFADPLA